jgi:hypothetical protein
MQMKPAEIFFNEDIRRFFLNLSISISVNSRTAQNETPRRKQRGILLDYNFFFVASDGEFNP